MSATAPSADIKRNLQEGDLVFYNAFPTDMRESVEKVIKNLPDTVNNLSHVISSDFITYTVENEVVQIPYRMYLKDIADSVYEGLNQIQKQILCCIYTRSCNGYIREKYIRKLLDMPVEPWAIPFIVKLCDEYIIEIVKLIYSKLKDRNNADIQSFCLNNKSEVRKSYSRMISYWNVYYRSEIYEFKNYVGRALFRECFGYNRTFEV